MAINFPTVDQKASIFTLPLQSLRHCVHLGDARKVENGKDLAAVTHSRQGAASPKVRIPALASSLLQVQKPVARFAAL